VSSRPEWKFLITYRGPSHYVHPDLANHVAQLTPTQHEIMLAGLATLIPEANRQADIEIARLRGALDRINAKGGVQVVSKRHPSTWPVGTEVVFSK
jgi:hypothetical protein